MSNARRLQTEIDRVMKKVDEGVELFNEIWEKVYSAEQQNQKEKYEMDLKREIKKLQRLRDQIKTWIGSSDVKDKEPLIDARKLIETKMEQFKICEKETKTKTYSKEGLARAEKLDPAEEAKRNTTHWIGDYIGKLSQLVEDREVEIERLTSGKGKKTNKHIIEEYNQYVADHKFHVNKLEGIMRLVNNDVLDVEVVENIKEDLDYYMDSYEDPDFQQSYDEEFFYEALGLDELDVVNVDRVTTAAPVKKKDDDAASSSTRGSKSKKSSKASALSSVIPLTIGRARVSNKDDSGSRTPSKSSRSSSIGSASAGPTPTTIPAARTATPSSNGGASMAAILKRETEQQEKDRQKLRAQAEQRQQQQQQLQRQQEAQARQQQEAIRLQQEAVAAKQKALQQQQQQQQQQEALRKQQQQEALKRQQQLAAEKAEKSQPPTISGSTGLSTSADVLSSSLGGMSLGGIVGGGDGASNAAAPSGASTTSTGSPAQRPTTSGNSVGKLGALDESYATMPNASDNERARQYIPQNPYPTPAPYPSTPSPVFDNPAVFEKLGTDCLFFIFYYCQGTYHQYLAARELKKQSWRFHKKYMTWFQRHEEPKVTTDEYEQGTYVYFDYETGWCTRIKTDFRFEYSYLEDSLS